MASGEKKGGDFVLEGRHLAGLFLLLVVIFGVVFTLGYLLGRSQYDTKVRTAFSKPDASLALGTAPATASSEKPADRTAPPAGGNSQWDFYHAAEPKAVSDHLAAPASSTPSARPAGAKPAASQPAALKAASAQNPPSGIRAPRIPKGAITLQVAAVMHEGDALALAQALQGKKFPAFVLNPDADKYFRVQVGPYSDNQSAGTARRELEAQGFKSITKR